MSISVHDQQDLPFCKCKVQIPSVQIREHQVILILIQIQKIRSCQTHWTWTNKKGKFSRQAICGSYCVQYNLHAQSSKIISIIVELSIYIQEIKRNIYYCYAPIEPHHLPISHFSSLLLIMISLSPFHLFFTLNFYVTLHLFLPLPFILFFLFAFYYYKYVIISFILYIFSHMKKVITLSLSHVLFLCDLFIYFFFLSLLQID